MLETLSVAFSMFSVLPVPRCAWSEKNMRFALCAFPLVGAVVGAAWWLWCAVCALVPVGAVLRGVGLCLLPVLLTGGIHLDGYADVCDALASCGAPEQKQAILKDPHCGAFAVIRLCTYFVASFALCAALSPTVPALWTLGLGFVFSRALSGFAVCRFPLARHTGLAHAFSAAADRRCAGRVLLLLAAAVGAAMAALGGLLGAVAVAAGLLAFWRCRVVAQRQFGGLSGDLAGWFVQRAELWMLLAAVMVQLAERTVLG